MLKKLYGRWMTAWETALTTQDTNRVVRPLEWGFDWLSDFSERARRAAEHERIASKAENLASMRAINDEMVRRSAEFYGYKRPEDYRMEERYPQLFPTNVRPETLALEARIQAEAEAGKLRKARFLRFTSPVRTKYPENDLVNARWYPARGQTKQAIIVMPQWNADAISHNVLCEAFAGFGVSALRLSKPYHDIRRPAEIERSDYAVSANIGRTLVACRQAVVDIRACVDWLETQGYEQFGVLGTSLGSCYAFIAAAHDARIRVCAFNHASTRFGDVVWEGQSTRHVRAAFEREGLTQEDVRDVMMGISPTSYMEMFAGQRRTRSLVVHALYDLTFPQRYSQEILGEFRRLGVDCTEKVLPCGHYTTGEFPYKYIDGWYLGAFVYSAFKRLRAER